MLSQTFRSSISRIVLSAFALCLGAFIGVWFTGLAEAAPKAAQTQTVMQGSATNAEVAPSATSGVVRIQCPPNAVSMNVGDASLYYSVSIWSAGCPGADAIEYWQFSGDLKKANQILAIALSAQA